jgi:hypothetical protein
LARVAIRQSTCLQYSELLKFIGGRANAVTGNDLGSECWFCSLANGYLQACGDNTMNILKPLAILGLAGSLTGCFLEVIAPTGGNDELINWDA